MSAMASTATGGTKNTNRKIDGAGFSPVIAKEALISSLICHCERSEAILPSGKSIS